MRISPFLLPLLAAAAHSCAAFVVPTPSRSTGRGIVSSGRRSDVASYSGLSVSAASTDVGAPGTADLPWSELGFEFRPTKSHLRMVYRDGKWGEAELVESPYLNIHIGATALHYGQSCFEGLKAFAHDDGSVNLFRPDENAKRIQRSAKRVMMPEIPSEVFIKACNDVVKDNIAYVPPYGSNGALYLRPLLFGSGPRIGLQPAEEYTFLILVIPVGDYYKGGLAAPVNGLIVDDYDRAAPKGVGAAKVAGNYAADLIPNMEANAQPQHPRPLSSLIASTTINMSDQVRTAHLLIKHTGSRNPVSRRTGAQVTMSPDEALEELRGYEAKIRAEGVQEAFPKYAGQRSDCSSCRNNGDLGFFARGQMQKPFEDASFGLQVGEMSGIISTDSGFHLIYRIA